jgi:hypothetical protein
MMLGGYSIQSRSHTTFSEAYEVRERSIKP